jgi:hypothetical protein
LTPAAAQGGEREQGEAAGSELVAAGSESPPADERDLEQQQARRGHHRTGPALSANVSANVRETRAPLKINVQGAPGIYDDERDGKVDRGLVEGNTTPIFDEREDSHRPRDLRNRVRAVEVELEAERRRTGRRVMGRHAVLAQSWRDQPTSREPRRNLRPRVATRSKWARIEALLRNRALVEDYVHARARWQEGAPVAFPPGTYWLRRFAYVSVAET